MVPFIQKFYRYELSEILEYIKFLSNIQQTLVNRSSLKAYLQRIHKYVFVMFLQLNTGFTYNEGRYLYIHGLH